VDSVEVAPAAASVGVSFDDFFASEYRRVVALALALCGRPSVAEECAQDAFVAAYRNWDRIVTYDDAGAWVRRVAANVATSTLRRRAREARAFARLALRREHAGDLAVFDDDFWAAVRALPRRQAQSIALRYLEDRSIDDIAAVLGISAATVRVHLHAARTALATVFHEPTDEDST
jgi:RNA polymerase sigma-70 factor (ECF subfamily)